MRYLYVASIIAVTIIVAFTCWKYKVKFKDSLAIISSILAGISILYIIRMVNECTHNAPHMADLFISFVFLVTIVYCLIYCIARPISIRLNNL